MNLNVKKVPAKNSIIRIVTTWKKRNFTVRYISTKVTI